MCDHLICDPKNAATDSIVVDAIWRIAQIADVSRLFQSPWALQLRQRC